MLLDVFSDVSVRDLDFDACGLYDGWIADS